MLAVQVLTDRPAACRGSAAPQAIDVPLGGAKSFDLTVDVGGDGTTDFDISLGKGAVFDVATDAILA